jgi:hypothetical protein
MVTDAVVRWNGWSLSARRPGSHLDKSDKAARYNAEEAGTETEFGLAIAFGPPVGDAYKLPRLRFGRTYQLRARTVDLAGNSLSLSDLGPASGTSEKLTYTRFEPVVAPTIALHESLVDGESLATIVIRSNNTDHTVDNVPTPDTKDRHIAPAICSQLLAEQHGMFDAMTAKDSYALVTSREGTYAGEDKTSGAVVHPEAKLPLPYLPDPLALGAAFLGLPGIGDKAFLGLPGAPPNKETTFHSDGTVTVKDLGQSEKPPITLINVDFDAKAWPDAKPLRIHVIETDGGGDTAPKFDATERELTIQLPKAEIARVRLSSYISEDALVELGIWKWVQDEQPPLAAKQIERLKQLAGQGRHWLLTPYRELVFVHAVQQPIGLLDLSQLKVTRLFGATYATLHDQLAIHAKSTVKIDMHASWKDTVDDPVADIGSAQRDGAALAFTVPVSYPHLPEQPTDDVAVINHHHDFHDTKHRWVNYTAVATTRFREFFTSDLDTPGFEITRSSAPIPALSIPSSVRPDAPKVAYVVPTFKWSRRQSTAEAVSVRQGGGLRLYLENPWYSSGVDELLGVVLADPDVTQDLPPGGEDRLRSCLSHWGADPIWPSAVPPFPHPEPQLADFPLAGSASRGRLTLEEIPGYQAAVAAHDVEYDPGRQLWFSDIVIDAGSAYSPFVRLALARYQPYSVEIVGLRGQPPQNVHLSRIVLADFAQLVPTRTARVNFGPPITVTLAGVGVHGNEIHLGVEAQRPDLPTDLGWLPLSGATAQPAPPPATPEPLARRWIVTLPAGRPTSPRRLVIKEYETMPTDVEGTTTGKRLVYAETFTL